MSESKKILTLPDPSWNETGARYPDSLQLQELFELQASKSPQALALIDGDTAFTYAALNALANRLARVLQSRGVGDGSVVGCYLTRSASIVISTLAVLKAGGAYVLLDSNLPLARLELIVMDSGPGLVITDTVRASFNSKNVSFASLHELEEASRDEDSRNLAPSGVNHKVAYIAYTSGSTGRPKGVMISHQSVVNHTWAFAKEFALIEGDRVPLMSPITFDMATEEMFPPLASGCTLVVSKSQFDSIMDFHREINQKQYTVLNLPATLWQSWTLYMEANKLSVPETVRAVIAGSEEIETRSLEVWKQLQLAREVRWAAAYGTTETTVTSTLYVTGLTDDLRDEPFVPIGKPIANVRTYVLDDKLRPVGVGEEGELYIGGAGVAIGYLHLPELTTDRFVREQFGSESNGRMYKTGDIVRYRPDGNLVWLGRADEQFKLNGLRIEPGEIEAVFNRVPEVERSVVVLHRDATGLSSKQIVAFVTIKGGGVFDEKQLRARVGGQLPKLMVPTRIVQVREWPLGVNGKVDRKALELIQT